ncbi:hypothetical protein PF008_g31142, partial [Phytophthora fragariae]
TAVVKSRHRRKPPLRLRVDDSLYTRPLQLPGDGCCASGGRLAQYAPLEAARRLPLGPRADDSVYTRHSSAPPADDSVYTRPLQLPGDGCCASGERLALHAPALCVDESGAPDTAM